MDEITELINNLDYDNNSYFYHITSKGYGDQIIECGLFLKERNLNTTAIEIPQEMINDPIKYCEEEFNDMLTKREEMVIITCEKGEQNYIVERADNYVGDEKFAYAVSSEHILGYIDLKNMTVTYNPEYGYGGKYV